MARVAIVIVTFNSAAEIGSCLTSLYFVPDAEVVVVDNASCDGTQDIVRGHVRQNVRLIANEHNAGFAGGVNTGVKATSAELILLLNPDACLLSGVAAMVARFDSDPTIGIVGGRLVSDDGQPQTGFMVRSLPTPAALSFEALGINRIWPDNPVNWHYRCRDSAPMTPGFAEQPAGAFLMFSRQAWLDTGGFDERFYPVWFEDVDFCARVRALRYVTFYEPAAIARHTGGHSVNAIEASSRHKYWYGNLLKYAARHFGIIGFRVVCAAVAQGALLRAVCETPRAGFRAVQMYGVVFRLACSRLFSRRGEQVWSVEEQRCVKSVVEKSKPGADSRKNAR
jgi:GT2 family glycosyltransferase